VRIEGESMRKPVGVWGLVGVVAIAAGLGCGSSEEPAGGEKKSADTAASATSAKPTASTSPSSASPSSSGATPSTPVDPASALAHVPADCEFVAVADLAKVRGHKAFASLLPKVESLIDKVKPKDDKLKKAMELAKELGVTPTSAKTLAVCGKGFSSDKTTYGAVLGSDVKPGAFVGLVDKASKGSALGKLADVGGVKAISAPTVVLGQLADGPFAAATNETDFKALIPAGAGLSGYRIDAVKEVAFYGGKAFVEKRLAKAGGSDSDVFKDVTEVRGAVDLAGGMSTVRLTCDSPFGALQLSAMLALGKDDKAEENLKGFPAAIEMVKATKVSADGADVVLETPIEAARLEELSKLLVAELEKLEKKM
jgi:hypothetical protein